MIEMQVSQVGLDARSGSPVVVLSDQEKRRLLPIWIGLAEASAVQRAVGKVKPPRPMTHELLLNTLENLGAEVERVIICEIAEGSYRARIMLTRPAKKDAPPEDLELDARPSDAIVLALLAEAPILVDITVMAEAGVPAEPEREESENKEFRNFLAGVKASDFKLPGTDNP